MPVSGRAASPQAPRRSLGLYVHWPFCRAICPYCDFNVERARDVDQARWRRALLAAIDHAAQRIPGRRVASLFFGGGTPSLMPAGTVAAIVERVAERFGFDGEPEITLEANPNSAEAQAFAALRSAGVSRLSLGVQALDDAALKRLGRDHTAAEARRALTTAKALFPRVSFDLIYVRAGQTIVAWRDELEHAVELAAGHVSLYQLTIAAGTAFGRAHARGRLVVPEADAAAGLYETAQEVCAAAGLHGYEVSNHAAPGHESQHNLRYWRYQEYLGIGPGAHARLLDEGGKRWAEEQVRAPAAWLAAVETAGHGIARREALSPADRATEMLMMGLRLSEGVSLARFRAVTGGELEAFVAAPQLAALETAALLTREDGRLRATIRGRAVLDGVLDALLA